MKIFYSLIAYFKKYFLKLLRYLTPQCGCIKNLLRSISLKSVDETYLKNHEEKGGLVFNTLS